MKSTFFVVFLFLLQTHAFEVSKKSGKLTLSADCAEGKTVYKSLSRWNTNARTGKTCSPSSGTPSGSGDTCDFDITSCVPEHVVTFHGAKPEVDGPNCWNLSLVMSSVLPALRYSTPQEMNFYMRPPLCRVLKRGEKKEPGDIGAIRRVGDFGNTKETHGFIYIDDKIAYSKNGFSKVAPYELQKLDKVYNLYGVPNKPECRQNGMSPESSQCQQAVDFFRCDSMGTYLKKNKDVPKKVREIFANFDAAERCAEESLFKRSALGVQANQSLRDVSRVLLVYLGSAKSDPEISKLKPEVREFLLGSLQLRLEALGYQLGGAARDKKDKETLQTSQLIELVGAMVKVAADQLREEDRK